MIQVMILGAGNIGMTMACLLAHSERYSVLLIDKEFSHTRQTKLANKLKNIKLIESDINHASALENLIEQYSPKSILSSLPYHCNPPVMDLCKSYRIHYFDLTEDIHVTNHAKKIADGCQSALVPQCGLAPGFIGIAANSLMQDYEQLDKVKMRVGALPINSSNALQYSLTWSTDGVINEYGNPCHGIENSKNILLHPLEGLEELQIDGVPYEAFNTSGGLGSLTELYKNKINFMNYKTIRYPGHCKKMRFLMNSLKLNHDRKTLKHILENAIPKTYQDVVIIYISVTGYKNGEYLEKNYTKKIYPDTIAGFEWSAIQLSTASSACVILDLVLNNTDNYNGYVYQEKFTLEDFLNNPFSTVYGE